MDILSQLRRDEGVRYGLYKDSLGIDTFGTGFTFPIDDAENDFILANRIAKVQAQLAPYQWYSQLDTVRRGAVENLCYNVGLNGLLHFVHFIAALARQDWITAKSELANSLWAQQVGARAERLEQQILTGEWV
jgi:lysozyme